MSLARASDAGLDAARVPDDVVYRCPTVSQLAAFFAGLRDAGEDTDADSSADVSAGGSVREMEDLVARFAPAPMSSAVKGTALTVPVSVNGTAGDVVLVTGTTGSLGSHLLHALAGLPTVSRIYAFNRAHRHHRHHRHHHHHHHQPGAPQSLLHRQEAAMAAHGLDASVLAGPKIVLLEGDLSVDGWGLNEGLMDEVRALFARSLSALLYAHSGSRAQMRESVSVVIHTGE